MGVADLIQKFQFVVDSNGEKQSVLIDYAVWEELLNLLEDLEDSEEISRLRDAAEESIPWEQAKVEPLSDDKFETLADQLADDFMDYVIPIAPHYPITRLAAKDFTRIIYNRDLSGRYECFVASFISR